MTKAQKQEPNWVAAEIRKGQGAIKNRDTSVPGTGCLEFLHPSCPCPVGQVWWRWGHDAFTIEIVDCYVMQSLRRTGIVRRLLAKLHEYYPMARRFTTRKLNDLSKPAFTKLGFVHDKTFDVWIRVAP